MTESMIRLWYVRTENVKHFPTRIVRPIHRGTLENELWRVHSIRALSSRSLRHPLGIIEDFNIKNCRDGAANVFRSRDARNRVEPSDRLYKKYETIIVRVILPESSGVSRTFVLLDTSCRLRFSPPRFQFI